MEINLKQETLIKIEKDYKLSTIHDLCERKKLTRNRKNLNIITKLKLHLQKRGSRSEIATAKNK